MRKAKRSLDYEAFIKERAEDLLALERRQGKALLRDRVRFLRLLKSGECTSQARAGKQIGLKRRAAEKLWSKYSQEGLAGLLDYPYKGARPKLCEAQTRQLEAELRKDGMQTLQQGCAYVAKAFKVSYSPSGFRKVLGRLKVKKKTGRPVHVHKDEKGEKRFKKKDSLS
jgi:transposase